MFYLGGGWLVFGWIGCGCLVGCGGGYVLGFLVVVVVVVFFVVVFFLVVVGGFVWFGGVVCGVIVVVFFVGCVGVSVGWG